MVLSLGLLDYKGLRAIVLNRLIAWGGVIDSGL